jgi:hypothetical protein
LVCANRLCVLVATRELPGICLFRLLKYDTGYGNILRSMARRTTVGISGNTVGVDTFSENLRCSIRHCRQQQPEERHFYSRKSFWKNRAAAFAE